MFFKSVRYRAAHLLISGWMMLIPAVFLCAQEQDLQSEKKLTHHMSPEEKLLKGEIGKSFVPTAPPTGPVYNVAEFDKMQAVLIRYPFGISYQVIKEMAEDINVVTIVANTSQQSTVLSNYVANGVNTANCSFLIAPTESYWTRDYGPWFVFDGNGNPGIVDFPYNRPSRPNDDDIPVKVAQHLGINLYGMNVIHTGGNYMTDGMGISSSSELVWEENPTLTHAQIATAFQNYLGISTYHVVPDPNNTYIDHIDCWGKFLDVDKVLIRQVPPSHAQYNEIEATAAYYAAQMSSYGVPYQVFRVYTPNNQPYTNSLILNKKVLVPIMGSEYDNAALQVYQAAMPGYEVIGFTGSWESTDALHCRTKGIADIGMLRIKHIPILGNQPVQPGYNIQAEIRAYSNQPVKQDSVFVIYSINHCEWDTIAMINVSGNTYSASIPGQLDNCIIDYYLFAADQSGRNATHPFIGKPDPHQFVVGNPIVPDIAVNPFSLEMTLPVGGSVTDQIMIQNAGDVCLNFTGNISYNAKSKSVVQVYPINANYHTGTTTTSAKTEISLVKGYPTTQAGWMMFDISAIPDGATINSVEFHGYVNATYYPYWNINPVTNNPFTASPSVLYADIIAESSSGYYLYRSEASNYSTGWKVHLLGGNVNSDLQAALAQDWFAIGIMDRDNSSSYYIGFDGWNEINKPYLVIDYSYVPAYIWLTLDGGLTTSGLVQGQNLHAINVGYNATGLNPGVYTAGITINSNDPDMPSVVIPVTLNVVSHLFVDLKVNLEGAFNGTNMNEILSLSPGFPLSQPYQVAPWNYTGSEQITTVPPNIVDWILIEYRDAPDAVSATPATVAGRQAAFVLNGGSVVDIDGVSTLQPEISISQQLFVVIYHRNHLPVMSSAPLMMNGYLHTWDFTLSESTVFGGIAGHKEIAEGIWGMIAGDCNADGMINLTDLFSHWYPDAGRTGYLNTDVSLDEEVNNIDKNDLILINLNAVNQIP